MIPFIGDPIGDYQSVSGGAGQLKPLNLIPSLPEIGPAEMQDGECARYFVRLASHMDTSDITEVTKTVYTQALDNALYNAIKIRWQIRGPLNDQYLLTSAGTSIRIVTGILTANQITIALGDEQMPGLALYVTNMQRFYIGE